MAIKLTTLEKKLFGADQPDLAWGALIASGLNSRRELDSYQKKIITLCQHFEGKLAAENELQKAKALFHWLWETKPNRYESQGNFRLTEILDVQLDLNTEKVGNCLGLTVLYNVLAQRFGLKVRSVHLEEAFSGGPHVFSIQDSSQGTIDIENIFSHGFTFEGHLNNPQRTIWADTELIADIYHSIGNEHFEQGKLQGAVQNYSKAIQLNPKYTKAYLNRGLVLSVLGQPEKAKGDFERAEQ